MRKILCTVNAAQIGDETKMTLQAALRKNYAEHISAGETLAIIWCELPAAQGYTNYRQPCVSLVVIEAHDGLDQEVREAMLSACANDWSNITGIDQEKLMITVFDKTEFSNYSSANLRRMTFFGRVYFSCHMAASLLRSKATRGLLAFNPNLGI